MVLSNAEVLICMCAQRQKHSHSSRNVHSCSNSELYNMVLVLGITAGQLKIMIDSVVCPITLEWIIWRYPVQWLEIHCFSNNVHTTIMAYHDHCILVQWKQDILVSFTNSVLWWSVWSGCIYQTSKLVSLDISIVSIFIPFYARVSVWWHLSISENFFEKNTCQPCDVISA